MKVAKKDDKFLWLGNSPALDFVNTEIVHNGVRMDFLEQPADWLEWLRLSQTAQPQRLRNVARTWGQSRLQKSLGCAKDYRKTLRAALTHLARQGTLDAVAWAETNRLLQVPRSGFSLLKAEPKSKQHFRVEHFWIADEPEDFCRPIAWSFADLLARHDPKRIRKCENPECILFFLDTSKGGTRSWCSMNICGNKLRVAAFRDRLGAR